MSNEKSEIQKAVSEAARAMRAVNSQAQQKAARTNGAKGGRKRKELDELTCRCLTCPDAPKTTCPRGRAILRRAKMLDETDA